MRVYNYPRSAISSFLKINKQKNPKNPVQYRSVTKSKHWRFNLNYNLLVFFLLLFYLILFYFLWKNYPVSIFARRKQGKLKWGKLERTGVKENRWHCKFMTFYSVFIRKRTVPTAVFAAWNALHRSTLKLRYVQMCQGLQL